MSSPIGRGERGMTLIEMVVTTAVLIIFIGGTIVFLISQSRMTVRNFDRSDVQRGGRAAMAILEDKISVAGLGLPRSLAIHSFQTTVTCGAVQTPALSIASLDYARQWTLSSTTGSTAAGALTLQSANPVPPDPGGGSSDIDIEQNRWLFLFNDGTSSGHGLVRVGADRVVGSTAITIDLTDYNQAQASLDLQAGSTLDASTTAVLLASTSTFGVDCADNATHPYLYWANNVSTDKTPIASNVDTRPLDAANAAFGASAGDVVGLRFRFLLDSDGDGQADDRDGNGGFSDGDFATTLVFNVDPAIATNDDVMAVEVLVRLRSDTPDATTGRYRTEDFVRVIHTPNINTRSDMYIFVNNAGI
jgi:hypothetical protein